jgi:hypothetical protein
MATAHSLHHRHISHSNRRAARHLLALPAALFAGVIVLAVCYIAYVLWPRWPTGPVSLDAPSIPVIVAGTTFNIPPAAIRQAVQRKPGTQQRVDVAYLWPSLNPPDPATRPTPVSSSNMVDRVFMTIVASEGALPPAERVKTIYPRYLDTRLTAATGGLVSRPFRDGTPYQGEELIYDDSGSTFLVRCTRNGTGSTLGMCLYDRRIGAADVTIRFPRDWLEDWRSVAGKLDQLIVGLRANGG